MRIQRNKSMFGSAIVLIALFPLTAMAGVPAWIGAKDGGPPLWVSADEAAPDGQLRQELLPEASRDSLMQLIADIRTYRARTGDTGVRTKSGSDCVLWSIIYHESAQFEDQSLKGLFNGSTQVYVGTVTDSAQGFVNGFPGTLLEVTVKDTLKESTEAVSGHIYVHIQHAEILIDNEFLCSKSSRHQDFPEVGRRIFVFQRSSGSPPMLHASDVEILYERANGTISYPHGFLETSPDAAQIEETLISFNEERIQ